MTQRAKNRHTVFPCSHPTLTVNYKDAVAHTTCLSLILPAAKIIFSCLFDEKATKQIDETPLSNKTFKIRFDIRSGNMKEQLVSAIKQSGIYSLSCTKVLTLLTILI